MWRRDADRELVAKRRGDHNRLGFALQLVTVRRLGRFLVDPLDVPTAVVDYVAVQVGADDPSCVKRYLERRSTRFEHQDEIARVYGYREFSAGERELVAWLDDQAWTTGDGPKALFGAAVGWLREGKVLLPGVSTLGELVAGVRKAVEDRLYEVLASAVTAEQASAQEAVLAVPEGRRRSQLDLWRRGERSTTGRGMVLALDRASQIAGLRMRGADITAVPTRRVVELARYGMAAKAPKLARHPHRRKIATLPATVRWLEVTATDDALELFEMFMSNELIGRANKTADKETVRRHSGCSGPPGLAGLFREMVLKGRDGRRRGGHRDEAVGRHVNEGQIELPPSPWRLLRAFYAVWTSRLPDLDEATVGMPLTQAVRVRADGRPLSGHGTPPVPGRLRHLRPGCGCAVSAR